MVKMRMLFHVGPMEANGIMLDVWMENEIYHKLKKMKISKLH